MTADQKIEMLYFDLRKRISSCGDGELFPSVRTLIRETGASQPVVCSALARLCRTGLLKTIPGKGTFVCKIRSNGHSKITIFSSNYCSRCNSELLAELERCAIRFEFEPEIIFFETGDDVFHHLGEYETDAIVMVDIPDFELTSKQIFYLVNSPIPTILCGRKVAVDGIKYVMGNAEAAGLLTACYLWQQGHRKLGILFCEPHFTALSERARTIELFAQANNCEVSLFDCQTPVGASSVEYAQHYIKKHYVRDMKNKITALIVFNAEAAVAVLHVLQKMNVCIPDELSMISFGQPLNKEKDFLSVLDIPLYKVAEETMKIIQDQLSQRFQYPSCIEIMPTFLERHSVARMS